MDLGNDINSILIEFDEDGCFGYFFGRLNIFELKIIFNMFRMIVCLDYDVCVQVSKDMWKSIVCIIL